MGRVGLDISTQREEHVRLGVEWEEARLAGTDRAQLLERLRLLREVEGSRMGRSFGLREMARSTKRRLSNFSGPEPQGPSFHLSPGKGGGVGLRSTHCRPQLCDLHPGH